jgi:Leucine-rich repeat (LRR) protein
MFIKKDLRKIPLILAEAAVEDFDRDVLDEDEPPTKRPKRQILRELKLSRRKAEFNGSLNLLCQPKNAPSLFNLVNLSVYDCQIQSLDGIGLFGSPIDGRSVCCPSLEILNVGRNPIDRIPPEMAFLGGTLKEFWCDDCNITGPMPECILKLTKLETLQLSNNKIISIPSHIDKLDRLQMLCLDRNEIEEIPSSLAKLVNLTSVLLRYGASIRD